MQERTINFIISNWYTKVGGIVALIFTFVVTFFASKTFLEDIPYNLVQDNFWISKVIFALLCSLAVFLVWFFTTRYPNAERGKIGILIAIRDDDEKSARIKTEITEQFNSIIDHSSCSSLIQVVTLNNQLSKTVIDIKSAKKISSKTNCHFVIYGKLREYNGQFEFFPEFLVRHRPLKDNKLVSQGFVDALVSRKWRFLENETLDGIHMTVKNIREIGLYIIGIAAHQSFDFEKSNMLHLELFSTLKYDVEKKIFFSAMYNKLPLWISDSYSALAVKEFQNRNLPKAQLLLETSLQFNPKNIPTIQNLAYCIFETGDTPGAKKMISRLKKINKANPIQDVSWRYSEAFLYFLDGNYVAGLRSYKKAFYDGKVTEFSLTTCLANIRFYIQSHPEKIQFKFAICHILIKALNNYADGLKILEEFYTEAKERPDMTPLLPLARQYLEDSYKIGKIKESEKIPL